MRYLGRVVLAAHCAIAGTALGWEHFVTGDSRGFALAFLWPFVFLAAAVASAAYTIRPASKTAWQWSGALLILAYGSRAVVVLSLAVEEDWTAARVIGISTYSALAALVAISWKRIAAPWTADVGS